jgi:hypothetical protein
MTNYSGQSGELARGIEARQSGYSYDSGGQKLYLNSSSGGQNYINNVSGITQNAQGQLTSFSLMNSGLETTYNVSSTGMGKDNVWSIRGKDVQSKDFFYDIATGEAVRKDTGAKFDIQSDSGAMKALGFQGISSRLGDTDLQAYASRVSAEDLAKTGGAATQIAGFPKQFGAEAQYISVKQSGRGYEISFNEGFTPTSGMQSSLEKQIKEGMSSGNYEYVKMDANHYYIMPKDRMNDIQYLAGMTLAKNPVTNVSFDFNKNQVMLGRAGTGVVTKDIVGDKSSQVHVWETSGRPYTQTYGSLSPVEKVVVDKYYGQDIQGLKAPIYQALSNYSQSYNPKKPYQEQQVYQTRLYPVDGAGKTFEEAMPFAKVGGGYKVERLEGYLAPKPVSIQQQPQQFWKGLELSSGQVFNANTSPEQRAVQRAATNLAISKSEYWIPYEMAPPYLPGATKTVNEGTWALGMDKYNYRLPVPWEQSFKMSDVPYAKDVFYTPAAQDTSYSLGYRYKASPTVSSISSPESGGMMGPEYLLSNSAAARRIAGDNALSVFSGEASRKLRESKEMNMDYGTPQTIAGQFLNLVGAENKLSYEAASKAQFYEAKKLDLGNDANKIMDVYGYTNPSFNIVRSGNVPTELVRLGGKSSEVGLSFRGFAEAPVVAELGAMQLGEMQLRGITPGPAEAAAFMKPMTYAISGMAETPRYMTDIAFATMGPGSMSKSVGTYATGFAMGAGGTAIFNKNANEIIKGGEVGGASIQFYSTLNPAAYKLQGTTAEKAALKASGFDPLVSMQATPAMAQGMKQMALAGGLSMGGAAALSSPYQDALSGKSPDPVKAGLSGVIGFGIGGIAEPLIQMGSRKFVDWANRDASASVKIDKAIQSVEQQPSAFPDSGMTNYRLVGRASGSADVKATFGGGRYDANIQAIADAEAAKNNVYYEGVGRAQFTKGDASFEVKYPLQGYFNVKQSSVYPYEGAKGEQWFVPETSWYAKGYYRAGSSVGEAVSYAKENMPIGDKNIAYTFKPYGFSESKLPLTADEPQMFLLRERGAQGGNIISDILPVSGRNEVQMWSQETTSGVPEYVLGTVKMSTLGQRDIPVMQTVNQVPLSYTGTSGTLKGDIIILGKDFGGTTKFNIGNIGGTPPSGGVSETFLSSPMLDSSGNVIARETFSSGGAPMASGSGGGLRASITTGKGGENIAENIMGAQLPPANVQSSAGSGTLNVREAFNEGGTKMLLMNQAAPEMTFQSSTASSFMNVQAPSFAKASIPSYQNQMVSMVEKIPFNQIAKAQLESELVSGITSKAGMQMAELLLPIASTGISMASSSYAAQDRSRSVEAATAPAVQTTLSQYSAFPVSTTVLLGGYGMGNTPVTKTAFNPFSAEVVMNPLEAVYNAPVTVNVPAPVTSFAEEVSTVHITIPPPAPIIPNVPNPILGGKGYGPGSFMWGYATPESPFSRKAERGYKPSLTAAFFNIPEPKKRRGRVLSTTYTGAEVRGLI